MYFLASIPRSGSTLLGSLLNQRSDTYVSNTSNLGEILGAVVNSWETNPTTQAQNSTTEDLYRVLKSIVDARYSYKKETIIIDKGRGWPAPQIMTTMEKVLGEPIRIIATVRPIAECLASFIHIAKATDAEHFCKNDSLAKHIFSSYQTLKAGWEKYPDNILFIEYDNLINNTQYELDRISDFLGIKHFKYDINNIISSNENDEIWGVKDLHKVRSKVSKDNSYDTKKILGEKLWNFYQGGEFWNDKPEPKREPQLLDLQVEALYQGNYEKAWEIAQQLEKEQPECNRAAFNRGWHLLRQGKLQEGHILLDRGRLDNVFGNSHIGSTQPIWRGESNSIVLLNLEAGIGDQIHSVRFARDIAARNNMVIVACSPELVNIIRQVEGVSLVIQHGVQCGVCHDYWLPSMSSVVALEYEYENIIGAPYLLKPLVKPHSGFRIGLRWQGNPEFEHAQKRLFPPNLLFDAVKGYDCISLQKGEGSQYTPDWVTEVCLDTWEDTAKAIASCDLVISSCTAIAHLSGAMGIETWTVVPKICYYLWALQGDNTPYYNNMTLFRQETIDNWEAPFRKITQKLKGNKDYIIKNESN